jgi:RNA polymerase sigma-70 factor (ECF subfamily)
MRTAVVRRPSLTPAALTDPDVSLMLRVQADDAEAFAQILRRHRLGVYQQLYLMVGHHEEAEDLTQEVFLRVYRHRKGYQPRAKFVTWLFHIVRNVARNCLRSRRRHPVLPLQAAPLQEQDVLEPILADSREEAPSQPLERRELRGVVRAALTTLQRRQRRALELQQYEECSYAEIANDLALSTKAAKSLLYRARNQMRQALTPYLAVE